jgi:glycosyltransferase involved in cell wall biosynthesis
VRRELGVPAQTVLIGLIARFHPQKDHATFIRAASLLHSKQPHVRFVLAGDGVSWNNATLAGWITRAGLAHHTHLLEARDDIPRLTAALDIATSSASHGEAFPLVIGEAMCCGVPCVVTDVGDSAVLVASTGRVVPPGDAPALARAWHDLIESGPEHRAVLGWAARHRMEECFELRTVVRRYEQLYQDVLLRASYHQPHGTLRQ